MPVMSSSESSVEKEVSVGLDELGELGELVVSPVGGCMVVWFGVG